MLGCTHSALVSSTPAARLAAPSIPAPHIQALQHAVECMDGGGPAAVARRSAPGGGRPGPSGGAGLPGRAAAEAAAAAQHLAEAEAAAAAAALEAARVAAAEEARRRAEAAEAEAVLAAFEKGGVARARVARVERVQHLPLWSEYQRCGVAWGGGSKAGAGQAGIVLRCAAWQLLPRRTHVHLCM